MSRQHPENLNVILRVREEFAQLEAERARLLAQLDAERQGALAREEAVEEAQGLARQLVDSCLTPESRERYRRQFAWLRHEVPGEGES